MFLFAAQGEARVSSIFARVFIAGAPLSLVLLAATLQAAAPMATSGPTSTSNSGLLIKSVPMGGESSEVVLRPSSGLGRDGAPNDEFGRSIAVSGDTAIISTPVDQLGNSNRTGSVHVAVRDATGWSLQAKLSSAVPGVQGFGRSAAIAGDTLVVGAPSSRVGNSDQQGVAIVYVRMGAQWVEQQLLTGSDSAANDGFGSGVAVFGETIVVGAFAADVDGRQGQGAAYVFVRVGTKWVQQAKLIANDGAAFDFLGFEVSLGDSRVLLGAANGSPGGSSRRGAAYVFVRDGASWTQEARLLAADGEAGDEFGSAVALEGTTAVVAAVLDRVGSNGGQGSAYVFVRQGSTWTQQARLSPSDGATGDQFGTAVALEGDSLVVGSLFDDVGGGSNQGSAYVFLRSGGQWTQQQQIAIASGAAEDWFGGAVAWFSGGILVGAPYRDSFSNSGQGAVFVFARSGMAWAFQQELTSGEGTHFDWTGHSVALSGATAIVGAPVGSSNGNVSRGVALVFARNGDDWMPEATLSPDGEVGSTAFGWSVAISGDTALVGAWQDDPQGSFQQGAAYVFVRTGGTWSQQAKLVAPDGVSLDYFGYAVALDGDMALIGAMGDDNGAAEDQGSAYAFRRRNGTWSFDAKLVATDGAARDGFGESVALSGTVAVVGAPQFDLGASINHGAAYIFDRGTGGWTAALRLTQAGPSDSNLGQGLSVAISGDTVLVGGHPDTGRSDRVRSYVRRDGLWEIEDLLVPPGALFGNGFGSSIALSGNVALVGAATRSVAGVAQPGVAHVFARSGGRWFHRRAIAASDGAVGAEFGYSVALADGTALVGSRQAVGASEFAGPGEGAAYVFPGFFEESVFDDGFESPLP